MYENNNTVSIDWKGLFIKLIIVALIVFAIFKGYEMLSNKKSTTTSTPSTATQLFNANLESLRQAGENYYNYSNYPKEGQTVMVTLAELQTKGNIKELYDANGNECNGENSYVSVTNDGGQYKLKATLACGETSNYTVVMIGCECEGSECDQAIKKLENEKTDSKTSSSSSSNKTNSSNNSSTNKNNASNKNTNNKNNNVNNTVTPTTQKSTQVVDMSDNKNNNTTTPTTQAPTTPSKEEKQYTVTFDTNGGDYIEPQSVYKNERADEPDEPERDDARFAGWYYKGELFNFKTKITKDITLEAYYWETEEEKTKVYSAAWDTFGTTYVTVTHQLAIPAELREGYENGTIKNIKIKKIKNEMTMIPYSNDLYYYRLNHSNTFEGYNYNSYDYYGTDGSTLARLTNINARKTFSNTYDRWVTWTANVSNQCNYTIDGTHCNYGITYQVVWEYDIFTN